MAAPDDRRSWLPRLRASVDARLLAVVVAVLVCAVLWLVIVIVTNTAAGSSEPSAQGSDSASVATARAPWATTLPVPLQTPGAPAADSAPDSGDDATGSGSGAPVEDCGDPAVGQALAAGDDEAVMRALGGGSRVRELVASGAAPCIDLGDPSRSWVVVNKARPLDPAGFAPASTAAPASMTNADPSRYRVRTDVAPSLAALAQAARDAGMGDLGLNNGFRPYSSQERLHRESVGRLGLEAGERLTLRPGYSEHQTGLAADVMACDTGCGTLESFGGTALGEWVRKHSWEHGWIVRYLPDRTDVTGIDSEPWHLRYIGPELARAYHDGGWTTLEEFFGLPAAPAYP